MSLAIAHFAVGAALTTLLIAFVMPTFEYQRTLVLVGGGWGLLPDVHWVSPVASEKLLYYHGESPLVDLFWFHRHMDQLDPADSTAAAAACIALLGVVTLFADWHRQRVVAPKDSSFEGHTPSVNPSEQR